jgi:hypothetical protein
LLAGIAGVGNAALQGDVSKGRPCGQRLQRSAGQRNRVGVTYGSGVGLS